MSTSHDDDEFWRACGPVMFTPERWAGAPEQVDRVLELAGVEPGAAVLDLACGPGRHSLELARRGFRVTGVDRTPPHLAAARAAAGEEGLEVEWVEADMLSFSRPESFDLGLSLYTSFGYFEDPEDDRRTAANLVESLRPGGALVMEMMGKEVLARIFVARDWQELPDGGILLYERKVSRGWSWIEHRWILLKDGERREFAPSLRIYSAAELTALLRDCGCSAVEVYGGFDGRPYDHEAVRLVAVARR
jgi:SAM-dependent methyltransferase